MKIPLRHVIVLMTVALITTRCYVVLIEVCKSENVQNTGHKKEYDGTANLHTWTDRKLAIVVPVHRGDQDRAIESLQRWPTKCHPLTLRNVDLVIYQAENGTNGVNLLTRATEGPGKCFRRALMASGNLLPEENVYPKGASIQFYKVFLDPTVRRQFIEYDALAILEWDVIVTHHSSFERLYKSAFIMSEAFWIKGSTLSGREFLDTALMHDQWHILGHLNGNAIYNNTDPAFIEFVNFTRSRWGYTYSYDVALWATISDFPYSWPLWQRYASRFVATNLISNVGFHDVSDQDVFNALSMETMFIHGSTKSLGSISNSVMRQVDDHVSFTGCTPACGSDNDVGDYFGLSTFCDMATCSGHDPAGSSFERFGCGAGDPSKFGSACRFCLNKSRDALNELAEDHVRLQQNSTSLVSDVLLAMCKTKPSETVTCTQQCRDSVDTICDSRCGDGWNGDFNCNWRGLGEKCRFCFHDVFAARLADKVAIELGRRVIMCNTYEPPLSEENVENSKGGKPIISPEDPNIGSKERNRTLFPYLNANSVRRDPTVGQDWSAKNFAPNIFLRELCVFIPGSPESHLITEVSVLSIHVFMPGARVVVATHPTNFESYNSTLAQVPGVSVVTYPHVQFAAVEADRACGSKTQLILYMTPGEILSRSFTTKDTHSPAGDLLVIYKDVEEVGQAHVDRALASSLLLGFHSPSFTFGTDLILPVKANEHLRAKLASMGASQSVHGSARKRNISYFQVIQSILQSIPTEESNFDIHIPEVLAASAFLSNLDGVRFVNSRQWHQAHLFREASIWDVPLIKPRFVCTIDTSLLEAHQTAGELRKWIAAFTRGARCELGYIGQIRLPAVSTVK